MVSQKGRIYPFSSFWRKPESRKFKQIRFSWTPVFTGVTIFCEFIKDWPDIGFLDDREGCLFTATVRRRDRASSQKGSQKIIDLVQESPAITIDVLANIIGVSDRAIKKQLERLKAKGRIMRVGPDKGGHWQVLETRKAQ